MDIRRAVVFSEPAARWLLGSGPQSTPDSMFHALLLLILIAGLVIIFRWEFGLSWMSRKLFARSIGALSRRHINGSQETAMITGMHAVIYTRDAEVDRSFFRDVLGFSSVDAGNGWLIFALPPSEVALHPLSATANMNSISCATT